MPFIKTGNFQLRETTNGTQSECQRINSFFTMSNDHLTEVSLQPYQARSQREFVRGAQEGAWWMDVAPKC